MLALTRYPGESIVIDGKTTVTVVYVRGDKVRLGIEAPSDVRVDRKEVHEERMAELDPEIEAELKELQGDKKATF